MNKKAGMIVMMLLLGLVIGLLGQGAEGLPELQLQKIVLEPPSTVTHGEEVMIRAWVMNTGDRPADDFKVEFFYRLQREGESWTSFYTVNIHDLAPSRQAALEIKNYGGAVSQDIGQLIFLDTSLLELGTYEIRVVADSNDQIPETDELNNELQTTLTLIPSKLGLPDLQPVGLSFAQPMGEEDGPVTVNIEIRNTGDENAGPFRVAFLIGDQQFAEKYVVGLPSGASTSLTGALDPYTLDLGPGTYIISGVVDADNQLEEQDEANNTLTGSLTLQELELHPISLGFDRSHVTLDGRVIVSSKITNTGKGVAKTVEVGFYVNNLQFALVDVGPIGFGQEVTALGELNPAKVGLRDAPQDYEIRVLVDPHDLLHESDEANNTLIKSLTILEAESKLPELHPESLELNPPSPIELGKADALTVYSVVKNTGKATADGFGVQFSYRVKGSRRWKSIPCRDPVSCTELALDSGAELKAEGNLPIVLLSPGIYEIRVAVDPLQGCDTTACSDIGKIEELDETNNELVTTFTLLSSRLPDLSPDPALGVEVAPSYMVKRGQTLRFLANIANLGDLAAGQFKVEFAYCRQPESISPEATDQMCAETDFVTFARASLPELGIGRRGQAQAILETTSLRPGTYHIRVLIDPTGPGKPEGEVKEQNEMNNILDISILLQGADLIPINLQLEPASPVIQGEITKVTATVQNIGVEPIGKFDVNFYWCRMVNEASCTREGEWASLGGVSFPGIAVNNPEPAIRELDTSTLEPGTYLLRVIVDPDDRAEEQSEINNELTTLLVIQQRLADLRPEPEINFRPQLPVPAGTPVEVIGVITNDGGTTTEEFNVSFRYRKLEEGVVYGFTEFYKVESIELAPGEQREVTGILNTSGMKGGTYEICIVADADSQVEEIEERNNTYCIPPPFVLISPPPDLQPEPTFTFDPTPPVERNTIVRVTGKVVNTGGSPADKFIVEFLYRKIEEDVDNPRILFASDIVNGLDPEEQKEVSGVLDTKEYRLDEGTYEICLVVDAGDFIKESNEENNIYCTPPPFLIIGPTAIGRADLVPTNLEIKPWPTLQLTALTSVTITNRGEEPAGPFDVYFFYEYKLSPHLDPAPVLFATERVMGLEVGEKRSIQETLITIGLRNGDYLITVVVDPQAQVAELNEVNNQIEETITIP